MIPVIGEVCLGVAWVLSGLVVVYCLFSGMSTRVCHPERPDPQGSGNEGSPLGGASTFPEILRSRFFRFAPVGLLRMTSHFNFFLILTAFLALITCHVQSDFSVLNVAMNSHSGKPLVYKISGSWGNHEGSMLLWVLVLGGMSALLARLSALPSKGNVRERLAPASLVILHAITFLFLAFILFTSNPFTLIYPAPLEGRGLNPLLQDIGLALHPPLLYLGYVGFSVPFAMAVAGMWLKVPGREWAHQVRPFVLLSWSFLTVGIALGSWWAYRELGWGGFWFWDPVENASLMPWLAGSALLHSVVVVEKRALLRNWTMLLAVLTFSLSLIGTFLVRSGVLTSVHAFANDPERGVFILLILAVVTGGGLLVFAFSSFPQSAASEEGTGERIYPLSREGMMLFTNLLLTVACAIVFLGTLYPLFLQLYDGTNVSIGPAYYAATFSPVALPLLLLAAIAPALGWKGGGKERLKIQRVPMLVGLFSMGIAYGVYDLTSVLGLCGIGAAFWLLTTMLLLLIKRIESGNPSLGFMAMCVAHIGAAVLVIGIVGANYGAIEKDAMLAKGGSVEVGAYRLELFDVGYDKGANYITRFAKFRVYRGADELAMLTPEYRFYPVEGQQTSEAAIYRPYGISDVYVVIGEYSEVQGYRVRAYYKPLITLIWLGAVVMAAGGVVGIMAWWRKGRMSS
jgi:cytochrome c-type biogenesis protein CcmF